MMMMMMMMTMMMTTTTTTTIIINNDIDQHIKHTNKHTWNSNQTGTSEEQTHTHTKKKQHHTSYIHLKKSDSTHRLLFGKPAIQVTIASGHERRHEGREAKPRWCDHVLRSSHSNSQRQKKSLPRKPNLGFLENKVREAGNMKPFFSGTICEEIYITWTSASEMLYSPNVSPGNLSSRVTCKMAKGCNLTKQVGHTRRVSIFL